MSPSGAELLRQVKSQIEEVDPSEVKELLQEGVAIVDVRENEEFAAVLRFDDQPIAFQLVRARRPHQKGDVRATLEQHSTKISAERARAQDQVSHLVPQAKI